MGRIRPQHTSAHLTWHTYLCSNSTTQSWSFIRMHDINRHCLLLMENNMFDVNVVSVLLGDAIIFIINAAAAVAAAARFPNPTQMQFYVSLFDTKPNGNILLRGDAYRRTISPEILLFKARHTTYEHVPNVFTSQTSHAWRTFIQLQLE